MLSGYRVIDLTSGGASLCGQMLADLGADVVLVEPPGGNASRREGPFRGTGKDPNQSLAFWAVNRGKRGIVIDLETLSGKESFAALAAGADFLIESNAPGYMDAHGIGYGRLSGLNPALVMVSITPFGQTGPKAHWAANDLTAWAGSVAHSMAGDDDRAPVSVAIPQAFLHAGAEGTVGALIAHTARMRDGRGQHVDISGEAASTMASQATLLSSGWKSAPTLRIAGGVNFGGIPLKFVNPATDGYVSVTFLFGSAIGPFTRRLMEVMCAEGFVDEATRDKDWVGYTGLLMSGAEPMSELMRCIAAIGAFTSTHTKAELFAMGMEKGLLIVPVNRIDDVVHSPQLAAREFWRTLRHPEIGTEVTYPGPFAKFGATPITYSRRPPLLGEHTAEVVSAPSQSRPPVPSASQGALKLPLEGLKVAEFMWVAAGPWGTRYLSEFGATVVKVESPTRVDTARTIGPFKDNVPGPERSGVFATLNANKLGVTLNLASPEGRAVAMRLCEWADVVTESFAPGAIARMGLSYDEIKKVNPNVIMISSCLNGQTGPQATLAGFGTMGAQIAGFGEIAGWPDRAPAGPAGAYTDYIAPKFTAAAILAAIEHRRKTGEGQYIDLSQSECSAQFLGPALLDYVVNGHVVTRDGNRSADFAPQGVYRAKGSDRWVAIAAPDEASWTGLAEAAGLGWDHDARYSHPDARMANADDLDSAIAAWTADYNEDELETMLQARRVPSHRVSYSEDAMADPQLIHRGHFITVEHPEVGPVPIEGSHILLSATPAVVTAPGPTFGQHNDYVLRDLLGMSEDEVIELVAAGALD
jgi:crotonobetainyl-CoA:carnitine CoA-transferase CaiB-like acyl-CoA transferase